MVAADHGKTGSVPGHPSVVAGVSLILRALYAFRWGVEISYEFGGQTRTASWMTSASPYVPDPASEVITLNPNTPPAALEGSWSRADALHQTEEYDGGSARGRRGPGSMAAAAGR